MRKKAARSFWNKNSERDGGGGNVMFTLSKDFSRNQKMILEKVILEVPCISSMLTATSAVFPDIQ
jgi:hypothetical protein